MKIIEQSVAWIQPPPPNTLEIIERAGRTCYKSEDKITPDSAAKFVQTIQNSGHSSVIEHVSASMLFVTDRGVTHEMVRHRIASFSQESTRYCNYGKEKFGQEVTFVRPIRMRDESTYSEADYPRDYWLWHQAMMHAEEYYLQMLDCNYTPQQARDVLPNSLKTEIVMTANMREWIHFFTLRCSTKAHPQMRDLALKALALFNKDVPMLFASLADLHLKDA